MDLDINTFKIFLKEFEIDGEVYKFYDVSKLNEEKYSKNNFKFNINFSKHNEKINIKK